MSVNFAGKLGSTVTQQWQHVLIQCRGVESECVIWRRNRLRALFHLEFCEILFLLQSIWLFIVIYFTTKTLFVHYCGRIIAVLHVMQMWYSDENSVCLSVRLSVLLEKLTRCSAIAERPRCTLLQFWPIMEGWNWETIFYGHYRSIINHRDVIGQQSNRLQRKMQLKGYYAVQGHTRSSRLESIKSPYATSY